MKRLLYLFVLSIFLFASCAKHHDTTIKIVETTDLHGAIFPYDFVWDKNTNNSQAQVSYYVNELRKQQGNAVILLDNGDILQGQPVVYYYNFVDTKDKHIVSRVMNYMKYDAATIGNHDIEAGHPVYDRLVKEFDFPWLSANIKNTKTGKPYFKPYTVIRRGDIKIAVLGLTTPGVPNWLPPDMYKNMEFEDMVESAKYWVAHIKKKEKPDILIGLFHSGHDYNYGHQDSSTYKNENATLLVAEKVPGFDVIFCGHDHDKYMAWVKNTDGDSVLIIDPAAHAKYVGIATIEMKWNDDKKKYDKVINGEIIATDTMPVDSAFMKQFASDFDTVKAYVSDTIGFLTKPLDGSQVFFGDNLFMDFIHNMQLKISGADISFAAPLSFRSYIDSGYVTVSDMFKLYRYENYLYTMRLKGSEIKKYLEFSYDNWVNTMTSPADHLLLFKEGSNRLKNKYYNFDSGEGIIYTVDVTKPDGQKVNIISMTDGSEFDTAKYYTVAINSYRGNGGGGLLTLGAGIPKDSLQSRIIKSTDKDLRYNIMEIFKQEKIIAPEVNNNWKFIPDNMVKPAAERDYNLLYGGDK